MSYLYCENHGREKEQEAIKDQGRYKGEITKIVYGSLIYNDYRCDGCNKPLLKEEKVYYIKYLNENNYRDTKEETEIIDMKDAKISIIK